MKFQGDNVKGGIDVVSVNCCKIIIFVFFFCCFSFLLRETCVICSSEIGLSKEGGGGGEGLREVQDRGVGGVGNGFKYIVGCMWPLGGVLVNNNGLSAQSLE